MKHLMSGIEHEFFQNWTKKFEFKKHQGAQKQDSIEFNAKTINLCKE